jgi:hypothetical protein
MAVSGTAFLFLSSSPPLQRHLHNLKRQAIGTGTISWTILPTNSSLSSSSLHPIRIMVAGERITLPSLRTLDLPMPTLSNSSSPSDEYDPIWLKVSISTSFFLSNFTDPDCSQTPAQRPRRDSISSLASRLSMSPPPVSISRAARRLHAPALRSRSPSPPPPALSNPYACGREEDSQSGEDKSKPLFRLIPTPDLAVADAAILIVPGSTAVVGPPLPLAQSTVVNRLARSPTQKGNSRAILVVGPQNLAKLRAPSRQLARGARIHPYKLVRCDGMVRRS